MAEPVEVSFCATNLNTSTRLPSSLDSIEQIGRAIGRPFETVVADGPSTDGARELLEQRVATHAGFVLVRHTKPNRGYGRRRAFEASRGTKVVPFDTSIVYDPVYAGILRGYFALATDRMLFSEISGLSRNSIEAVGGWRDLIGGADIDLYSRIIRRFGVIAYPTALAASQSIRLGAVDRQLRYVRGSRFGRVRRIYAVQRDQIVGANYRVRDLMRFNAAKPTATRVGLWLFFASCAIGARFRGIRPVRAEKNNYLVFRDALLQSMRAGDYRDLRWEGPEPRLLLSEDEIRYLRTSSTVWRELGEEVHRYVETKH